MANSVTRIGWPWDRELLRNPAARDLLDRYSAADEIAGEVLHELAATGTGVHQQTTGHRLVHAGATGCPGWRPGRRVRGDPR
jgi:hypothetical protein